jgi:hypothetical protein
VCEIYPNEFGLVEMAQDSSRINVALDQLIDNLDSVRQTLYIFTLELHKGPLALNW